MLAKAAGVSLRSVQRILEAHQSAPHRIRTFKLSNDPKFAEKLKDIVGLYVDPPAHAVVLSVDEKSQIQALDRTQPGLPMKPGRAGTMTHDYKRHGTTTLFAALNVLDGTVIGHNMKRHRHQEFIRFLNTIEAQVPKRKAIHAIIDNYATHKHPKVRAWLARHPRWTFHFTPTSASWLNAVEGFFAKLTRRRLLRGVFRLRRRSQSRHQSLRRRNKHQSKTIRLDRRSTPRPRRCQTWETSVRVGPLGSSPSGWGICFAVRHSPLSGVGPVRARASGMAARAFDHDIRCLDRGRGADRGRAIVGACRVRDQHHGQRCRLHQQRDDHRHQYS